MKREELLQRLEDSMLAIGKGMHHEQIAHTNCSPAQNHVLMVIGMRGDMGIKQLAKMLSVTSGAATQHVDALEKTGLLMREMNPSDRREVVVRLTAIGNKAYQEIRQKKARILSGMFSNLSDSELHTLVEIIEKVSHKFIANRKETYGGI